MTKDPVERARRARPRGWQAPGPPPAGPCGRADLEPRDGEMLAFLCGDWRIFQLERGHRWSLDDFMTALVAFEEGRNVKRALDLGCGIGAVLMMVAWHFAEARVVGVEAQTESATLARRSLAYNGADARCEVRVGDLRDGVPSAFDLVTATPPYIPSGHGLVSPRPQRGACRIETRGGIEDYCLAAARALAPEGVFVTCAGAQGPSDRCQRAARAAALHIYRSVEVVPRENKPTLLWVHAMSLSPREPHHQRFVVRDAAGNVTQAMHRAREQLGLPPQA